jgi:hypothetical protein
MYYEINVSLNDVHFFATNKRSIRTQEELEQVLTTFVQKFPERQGYKIEVERWTNHGESVDYAVSKDGSMVCILTGQ